ncbi:MAG TPA: DNA repair protein RecO [Verrucomicrobiae bacterium]|nr:DNA repair protein RecO [Verrucomicrobiae bacterium]
MIESSTGIILRTRPLTETSLIVHWLTPNFGRMATAAKGARRPKSPFAGKLDLFYELDFSFTRSRKSDLHILREVSLRETHAGFRADILKLQQAAYAVSFIEQATESDTPLPNIFKLLRTFLGQLWEQKLLKPMVISLELKLLHELGLEPDWTQVKLAVGTKKIAMLLSRKDFAAAKHLKMTEAQTEELRQFLHGFLIFHLGRLPRGRAAALAGEA